MLTWTHYLQLRPRTTLAPLALAVMLCVANAAWSQNDAAPPGVRGEDDATGTPLFIQEGGDSTSVTSPTANADPGEAPTGPAPDLSTDPILLNIIRGLRGPGLGDDASFRSMDTMLRDWLTTDTLIGGFEGSWTARVAIQGNDVTSPSAVGELPRVRVGDDPTFPDFTFDEVRILPGPTPPPTPTPETPTPEPEPPTPEEAIPTETPAEEPPPDDEAAPPPDDEPAPPPAEEDQPAPAEEPEAPEEAPPEEGEAPPPPPPEEGEAPPEEGEAPPEERGEDAPEDAPPAEDPPIDEAIILDLPPHEDDVIRAQADLRMISIEALVVEINRNYTRTLGIRHSAMRRDDLEYPSDVVKGIDLYVPAAFSDVSIPRYSQGSNSFELSNSRINRAPGLGLNFVGTDLRPGQLTIRLRMLLSEGKATVRTRPIISTLNRTVAVMKIGDQIPYQTYRYQPDGKIIHNIERKNVGIEFTVQPTIVNLERDLLELHIHRIRVSSIANMVTVNQITFPNLASSENTTRVVIKSGETLIIGGLQYDKTVVNVNRVPILGAIPIVGMLFRQRETMVENRDILFFVTPKILEPRESLALPFDFKNNVPIAIRHK